MSSSLDSLPYDIFVLIFRKLELEDAIHLAFTCRKLRSFATDSSICRHLVDTQFHHALEARQTTNAAEAMQRIYARRANLALATPSSVAVLGSGSSFSYANGILMYLDPDRMLRILDIHQNATTERVLDMDAMLHLKAERDEILGECTYSPVSYANGYAVVLCKRQRKRRGSYRVWLAILDTLDSPRHHPARSYHILGRDSRHSFVRQSAVYIVYGTHSALRMDGNHEWVIQIINLAGENSDAQSGVDSRFTLSKPICLTDLVGHDIGTTVEFAIHGGWFYAITNETSFETEEVEWTSFYHAFRCRLDDPVHTCENNPYIFRRQHDEGPLNDEWTRLSLQVDEGTNELRIVETRREWVGGSSQQRRTFYTTSFTWPSETTDDPGSWVKVPKDDIMVTQLASDGKIRYREAPERQWSETHPEPVPAANSSASSSAQPKFSYYNMTAMTCLDIINDPIEIPLTTMSHCPQRLRLRMGSRRLRSPLDLQSDGQYTVRPSAINPVDGTPIERSNERFKYSPAQLWPAADAPQQLWDEMNPPAIACCRNPTVDATADERSLIYMTGEQGSNTKMIVGISFDPFIRFANRSPPRRLSSRSSSLADGSNNPATCISSPLELSSDTVLSSSTLQAAGQKRHRLVDNDLWHEEASFLRLKQAIDLREDLPW